MLSFCDKAEAAEELATTLLQLRLEVSYLLSTKNITVFLSAIKGLKKASEA